MTEAEAVAEARALIAARFAEGRHHVAAAMLTDSGALYLGLNLETELGWAVLCAEQVALGSAATAEAGARVVFAAAIDRDGAVIPPCGRCRELLAEYGPAARIAVPGGADYKVAALGALLPHAYDAAARLGAEWS